MKRSQSPPVCWILLLCSVPAVMFCVSWVPKPVQHYLWENARPLYTFFRWIATLFPSWPQFFALQTLAAALAVAAVLRWRFSEGPPWKLGPHEFGFLALLLAYFLWIWASTLWSAWPYGTRARAVRELPFLFLCGAAALLCRTRKRWLTFATVFAVAVGLQAFLQSIIIVGTYISLDRPFALRFLRGAFYHNPVFYSNRNFACAPVITGGLLITGLLIRSFTGDSERSTRRKVLVGVAGGVALLALAFVFICAGALAGYVALAVAAVAYGFCILKVKRRGRVIMAVVFLALAATGLLLSEAKIRRRIADWALSEGSTAHLRVIYWAGSARMYSERPVLGWGAGTFPAVYPTFELPMASGMRFTRDVRSTHPHNEFVRVGTELGVVGLALYLAILAFSFVVSFPAVARAGWRFRLIGYGLWAGCLAFLVQSLFGKAPMNWSFAAQFWILLGVLASAPRWGTAEEGEKEWPEHWRAKFRTWLRRGRAVPGILMAALAGAVLLNRSLGTSAGAAAPPPPLLAVGCIVAGAAGLYLAARPAKWRSAGPALAVLLVLAGWWLWGVGAYRSMRTLRKAEGRRSMLRPYVARPELFREFRQLVDRARGRCLWPVQILYYDYVIGWRLTDLGRLEEAREYLLERVFWWSPDMLQVRLLLARCTAGTGNPGAAVELILEHIRRKPYDLDGYRLLGHYQPSRAATLLRQHLRKAPGAPEQESVDELIVLYALAGRESAARGLIRRVAANRKVSAAELIRSLAAELREAREVRRLGALRKLFPEVLGDTGTLGQSEGG